MNIPIMEYKYHMYLDIDTFEDQIAKMTPKEAEGTWYGMWGLSHCGGLSEEWFKPRCFGLAMMLLAKKVGREYDVKTMMFKPIPSHQTKKSRRKYMGYTMEERQNNIPAESKGGV